MRFKIDGKTLNVDNSDCSYVSELKSYCLRSEDGRTYFLPEELLDKSDELSKG